jgi:hypothetical protein
MVFPQGVFSKASLKVLREEGFSAAVNSTIYPADGAADEITFRDFMEPAVVRFGGMPLFLRHYPERLETLALDVFLGRQVLLVEHHGFFRRGYDELARFTAFVNRVAPSVKWTDLEELCTSAQLIREESADSTVVRGFGRLMRLKNESGRRSRFHISNHWALHDTERVTWNGVRINVASACLDAPCSVELDASEQGELMFWPSSHGEEAIPAEPSASTRLKVFARRHLCEFRDNYLEQSDFLSHLARLGKGWLPRL